MTTPYRMLDDCLATLGTAAFATRFLDLVEWLGADQIMVFGISDRSATCLLSRNFARTALGGRLATRYLDGWYRSDPLLPELRTIEPGEIRLRRMEDFAHAMAADYREIFFDRPGLAGKTALLAAGRQLSLMLNLYHVEAERDRADDDVLVLAARLCLLHFESSTDIGYPAPLAALSDRERTVCLGILAGRKAEMIAGNLNVATSTVVTYRKRAYEKLGISSRAALFAICGR